MDKGKGREMPSPTLNNTNESNLPYTGAQGLDPEVIKYIYSDTNELCLLRKNLGTLDTADKVKEAQIIDRLFSARTQVERHNCPKQAEYKIWVIAERYKAIVLENRDFSPAPSPTDNSSPRSSYSDSGSLRSFESYNSMDPKWFISNEADSPGASESRPASISLSDKASPSGGSSKRRN